MFRKTNNKLDYTNLNEVIKLSKLILKILFVVMVIVGLYGLTIILKEWGIIKFFIEMLQMIAPLFIGIVIAWLFNPIMKFFSKKGIRRGLGAAIIYIVLSAIIFLIIKAIIPLMFEQINDLVSTIPSTLKGIVNWINDLFNKVSTNSNVDLTSVKSEIIAKIENYGMNIASSLPEIMVNTV